jgi:hypothetical protein
MGNMLTGSGMAKESVILPMEVSFSLIYMHFDIESCVD